MDACYYISSTLFCFRATHFIELAKGFRMCNNANDEKYLKEKIKMSYESLELASAWLHTIGHQAGPGHQDLDCAPQIFEAEAQLKQVLALLREADSSIESNPHSHNHNFEVELA